MARTSWFALAVETDGEKLLASDIEQALEEDGGRRIPGRKVTAVQVAEKTHDRLVDLARAFEQMDAEVTVDPIEEASEEVVMAYRRWVPQPQNKDRITDLVLCVDRLEHRLKERREQHDGPRTTRDAEAPGG